MAALGRDRLRTFTLAAALGAALGLAGYAGAALAGADAPSEPTLGGSPCGALGCAADGREEESAPTDARLPGTLALADGGAGASLAGDRGLAPFAPRGPVSEAEGLVLGGLGLLGLVAGGRRRPSR